MTKLNVLYLFKFPASRGLSRRGKNERKERVSLLSLIFASSWETSASRERFKKKRFQLRFKKIKIYLGVFKLCPASFEHTVTFDACYTSFFDNQYKPFAEWARQSLFNFSWYPSQMSLKLTESCVSSDWARQCSAASYTFFKQSS